MIDRWLYSVGLCVIVVFVSLNCSSKGEEGTHRMAGTVQMVGNEPFARLALQTDDGQSYYLQCDSMTTQTLRQNQGKRFTVVYRAIEDLPDGKQMTVLKADPVTQ